MTRFARPSGRFLAGSSSVQLADASCRPPVGASHPPVTGEYKRKKPVLSYRLSSEIMAVRGGFEPPIRCRIHTFQACSFSHSDTSPCCHPDAAGTGANVGKSGTSVNHLFQLISAFRQTSNNMLLKCSESDFFLSKAVFSLCYQRSLLCCCAERCPYHIAIPVKKSWETTKHNGSRDGDYLLSPFV